MSKFVEEGNAGELALFFLGNTGSSAHKVSSTSIGGAVDGACNLDSLFFILPVLEPRDEARVGSTR
jgi:hypothetical protein